MLPTTAEWVGKAEGDFDVVSVLLRSRKGSRRDAICFHAQQCCEKYLKAVLTEAGIRFNKTHDLTGLLTLCLAVDPTWYSLHPAMHGLTRFAVAARYPGLDATPADSRDSTAACRRLRRVIRTHFNLPV